MITPPIRPPTIKFNAHGAAEVIVAGDKPYPQPPYTERDTTDKPYLEIVRYAVVGEYRLEHGKEQPCEKDRQHSLFQKVFYNVPACHVYTPFQRHSVKHLHHNYTTFS